MHTAGRQSCRCWAQCRRHTRRMCRSILQVRQSSPHKTRQRCRAPCLDRTNRTPHPCQHTLTGTPGMQCCLPWAPGLPRTERTVHQYRRRQPSTQHTPSSARWAHSRRRTPHRNRPSRLTQHCTTHTMHGLLWAPCPPHTARTIRQMSGRGSEQCSQPSSPRRLYGWHSVPGHSGMLCTTVQWHSQLRHQSAHTSHSRPPHQGSVAPDRPPDHADAIQARSSCMSSHRCCAHRRRRGCTSTVSRQPRYLEDRWRTQSRRR